MPATFSRISPSNKTRLIQVYQSQNSFTPQDLSLYTILQKNVLLAVTDLDELRRILNVDPPNILSFPTPDLLLPPPSPKPKPSQPDDQPTVIYYDF